MDVITYPFPNFKVTTKLISFSAANSPVIGEFLAESAGNAKNDSIWWRHHVKIFIPLKNIGL